MAAHRKLDRRRTYLYAGGLRKGAFFRFAYHAQFALLVPVLTNRSCFSLSASDFSFRSSSFSVSAVSCSYGVSMTTPLTSSGRDVRSGNVCRAESVAPESVRLSFESITVAGGVTFTAQK